MRSTSHQVSNFLHFKARWSTDQVCSKLTWSQAILQGFNTILCSSVLDLWRPLKRNSCHQSWPPTPFYSQNRPMSAIWSATRGATHRTALPCLPWTQARVKALTSPAMAPVWLSKVGISTMERECLSTLSAWKRKVTRNLSTIREQPQGCLTPTQWLESSVQATHACIRRGLLALKAMAAVTWAVTKFQPRRVMGAWARSRTSTISSTSPSKRCYLRKSTIRWRSML